MKIKVKVQHGANNTPAYVSIEPNRHGVYKAYTEAEYKANPSQFEIVKESAKVVGGSRVNITHNEGLILALESAGKPEKEFKPDFSLLGLKPEEAKIAINEPGNTNPKTMTNEDWLNLTKRK